MIVGKYCCNFQVNSVAFSPDFQIMVTGCDDERVRVFNTNTGSLVCKLKGHSGKGKYRKMIN